MKALLYRGKKVLLVHDAPEPAAEHEVLLGVRMAGICRTDLELAKGYMGYEGILGHEFVGEVISGSRQFVPGTRVVGEINAGCGECEACRRGMQRHCPNRMVLGIFRRPGCMAQRTSLPEENLLAVPDSVADEEAVFTEPLAAALEIFEQVQVQPRERVAVIGDGKLGLLITMVFAHRHEGFTCLLGHHEHKLEAVKDVAETRLEHQPDASLNRQFNLVIEATGRSRGLQRAMQLVRPRGTLVLKSTMAQAEAIDLTPLVIDEVTLVGSRCGRFEPALRLIQKKCLQLHRLIEAVYPLDEALIAWEKAIRPGAMKILLKVA